MHALRQRFVLPWIAALALVALQCAVQVPPGGGPRDLDPPIILESTPAKGQLNFNARELTITFDKRVDRRAVQDAFFISPALQGKPEFSWSGRQLTITLSEPLRANTTYTVSLGTDVYEIRENVHLATPFSLSFSTGATLDSARISGKVFSDNRGGAFVFAYAIDTRAIDTLNPTHTPPDYLAPVGADSAFTIPALPLGRFRVFAIKDEQRNMVYDVGSDGFAAARNDVVLTATAPVVRDAQFRLGPPRDTVAPELTGADAITTTHVRANFSEPLDSTLFAPPRFTMRDSIMRTPVVIRSVTPSSRKTSVELYLDALTPDALYLLSADSLRDASGNLLRRATVVVTGTTLRDTMPPIVTWPMRDSTTDVSEGKIIFSFSEPIQRRLAEYAVVLSDSVHPQIPLRFRWPNEATMVVYNDHEKENQWYTLTIAVNQFADPLNNHTRDSSMRIRFRTRDPRTLGAVKGTITDATNSAHSSYYITAHNVVTGKVVTRRVGDVGAFAFDDLPDGSYGIDAFRDDDGNGVLSSGDIFPYHFAEPYVAVPGTLRVRARWTVEGVRIEF